MLWNNSFSLNINKLKHCMSVYIFLNYFTFIGIFIILYWFEIPYKKIILHNNCTCLIQIHDNKRKYILNISPSIQMHLFSIKICEISSHAMHYCDKKYTLNLDAENWKVELCSIVPPIYFVWMHINAIKTIFFFEFIIFLDLYTFLSWIEKGHKRKLTLILVLSLFHINQVFIATISCKL